MVHGSYFIFAVLSALSLVISEDSLCVDPGTCTPPASKFVKGRDVVPRYQWTGSGGFCGSSSIQSIIQSFGAYYSQDLIRKAAPKSEGHGNPIQGYEILHSNIEPALQALGIKYNAWDWQYEPLPQGLKYLSWLKSQLLQDNGVVQFVICKGDAHQAYSASNVYDHIEPFFKLYTNHGVNDSTVFDDDIVAHGSGYSPDGEANMGYFRPMISLLDDLKMEGNCAVAHEGWMQNEMYPCLYENQTFGYALKGIECGFDTELRLGQPLTLFVNNTKEPNIRDGEEAVYLQGEVVISNLLVGSRYAIYRWDNYKTFPFSTVNGCENSSIEDIKKIYENSQYSNIIEFVADGNSYEYLDSELFLSSGSVLYSCVSLD